MQFTETYVQVATVARECPPRSRFSSAEIRPLECTLGRVWRRDRAGRSIDRSERFDTSRECRAFDVRGADLRSTEWGDSRIERAIGPAVA